MKAFKQSMLIFVLFSIIAAQNPTLNIQGVLRDASGNAVTDGQYQITFQLYNAATGGSSVGWQETHNSVQITNGVYSAVLGSQTAFNVPFNQPYFLSISVDGTVMEPRIPMSLSPYSLAVRGVDNVFPNTGNVGIGTASPGYNVHVKSDDSGINPVIASENDNGVVSTFRTGRSGWGTGSGQTIIQNLGEQDIILEGRNVGIGTHGPRNPLHLDGGRALFNLSPGSATNSSGILTGGFHNELLMGSFLDGSYGHGFISLGYGNGSRKFSIGTASSSTMSSATFVPKFTVKDNGDVYIAGKADIDRWQDQDLSGDDGYAYVGGLLIQWGSFDNSIDEEQTINFPEAFPNACFSVVPNRQAGGPESPITVKSWTNSSFKIDRDNGISGTQTVNWIAIGH